jgi:hypothetical protein
MRYSLRIKTNGIVGQNGFQLSIDCKGFGD